MKHLLIIVMLMFAISANAELVSETEYGDDSEMTIEVRIENMYNAEIIKQNSNLYLALSGFAKQKELSFLTDTTEDEVGEMTVDIKSIIPAGGGKSSCCAHVSTVLVPIWGSYKGTGMIEEIIGFLTVNIYTEVSDELATTKYAIEGIAPFTAFQ
jgi:hypothetical protein